METKKVLTTGTIVVIGALLICCIVCCTTMMKRSGGSLHRMPDGSMMTNGGDDMTSMMAGMNAALKGKTGDEFDKAFIDQMTIHHQGAVEMAELALTNAKHQEVKDLANAIIKAQTTEISQMKQWRASWFK